MGATHLLDTSAYSQPLRRRPLEAVCRRWQSLGDRRLCISVICHAELLQGIELARSPKLRRAYERILAGRLPILNVDPLVAETYARLAAQMTARGLPRPAFDLLIAATAKVHGLVVATCNYKDFEPIEGVAVEDWSR
ncbi:MAG: type II toxin-antitoxin system VapC family toxin [Deltaproteobacteria bacterium]|nr:type II toxin-antitoxin system VapC family toxin [Deltaproteobacteria bacterium]